MLLSFHDSASSSLGIKFACSNPWALWPCLWQESYPLHRPIDLVLFLLTAFCGHTTVFGTYRPSSLLLSKGLSVCYRLECLSLSVSLARWDTAYHFVLWFLSWLFPDSWNWVLFVSKKNAKKKVTSSCFFPVKCPTAQSSTVTLLPVS